MASRRSPATIRGRRPHLRLVRSDERPSRTAAGAGPPGHPHPRAPMPRAVALLLVAAFLLTGIGLVMVLSASSVTSVPELRRQLPAT